MATISGEVRDDAGDLVADVVVRAYRRDTGALLVAGLTGDGAMPDPGDDDYESVSLLLHCDDTDGGTTFVDNSPTPKTITAYGNAHIETDQSKFGGASVVFDGVGDYLKIDPDAELAFGTGDFTVEFFVFQAVAQSPATISIRVMAPAIGVNVTGGFQLWIPAIGSGDPNTNAISLARPDGLGYIVSTVSPVSDGAWHHVAFARSSGTSRSFFDGVLKMSAADVNDYSAATTSGLMLGGRADLNASAFFAGYLDDIRITKGVARYTADFTPPAAAFPDALVYPARPVGEYTLTTAYTGEMNVVALDPDGGTTFNDLILRTTPV